MTQNKNVEVYLSKIDDSLVPLVNTLRRMILGTVPEAEEKISWGSICYKTNKYLFSLSALKDYVRIDFFYGTKLKDPNKKLNGVGGKLRHLKIKNLNNSTKIQIIKWIKESSKLQSN